MMKTLMLIVLSAAALCLTLPALGELYQCNGTWTNTPCEGEASKPVQMKRSLSRAGSAEFEADEVELAEGDLNTAGGIGLTTLRQLGSPKGLFQGLHGRIVLTKVTIRIKNVGQLPAQNVWVKALMPDGSADTLDGPAELQPNEVGEYISEIQKEITSAQKIRADMGCDNCRN